jgi:hypothetical protein
MTGDNLKDQKLGRDVLRERYGFKSDAEVSTWLRSKGVEVIQHHSFDGTHMELIPTKLHARDTGIPHNGSASNLRIWDYSSGTPIQRVYANRIAMGGRALGYAGMVYGAYQDARSITAEVRKSQRNGDYSNTGWEVARVAGGWGGAFVLGQAGAQFGGAVGWIGGPIGSAAGAVVFGAIGGAIGYWGVSGAVTDVQTAARPR